MQITRVRLIVALTAAIFVAQSPCAHAGPITFSSPFIAVGFRTVNGVPAPVDPVTGSFSVTFDDAIFYNSETAGLTVTDLNIPNPSSFAFGYYMGTLIIGGAVGGAGGLQVGFPGEPATNDFSLVIDNVTTTPTFRVFEYTWPPAGVYGTTFGMLDTVYTPEPASMTLLGIGLCLLGVRKWNHSRKRSF